MNFHQFFIYPLNFSTIFSFVNSLILFVILFMSSVCMLCPVRQVHLFIDKFCSNFKPFVCPVLCCSFLLLYFPVSQHKKNLQKLFIQLDSFTETFPKLILVIKSSIVPKNVQVVRDLLQKAASNLIFYLQLQHFQQKPQEMVE